MYRHARLREGIVLNVHILFPLLIVQGYFSDIPNNRRQTLERYRGHFDGLNRLMPSGLEQGPKSDQAR